ncbi:IMPACT family protein [Rhizobium paknamense]|uniref:YigZ family protein n=1 Tax=Rhizobium paknamense TaxID=1206817 RepID=A0ABU0II59_9HYPH|nr:YigZ family protein [Rhizobium paknamense]MDQ0457935.1 putative YigZ family protein [Rhizobium paknamense]
MFTLPRSHDFEQDIKKSRFRALALPLAAEDEVKALLAAHCDPAATHNCWAWRLGQAYRFSDDGEPSGTAGKPILQALDGQKLDHVLVIVTRWFGGILLGSGGLIRAYGSTAAECLRTAEKVEIIHRQNRCVSIAFSDLALIKARLAGLGISVTEEVFTATGADLTLALPLEGAEEILALLVDLTAGRVVIHKRDD